MIERDFSLNYHVGYRNTRKGLLKKVIFWMFVLLIFSIPSLFVKNIFLKSENNTFTSSEIISPLAKGTEGVLSAKDITTPSNEGLKNVVDASLVGTTADYAVAIINLKSGEEYFYNEHMEFDSASLYKLWVMAVVFQWIEEGKLSLDKTLTQDVKTLNESFKIDEEIAEKKEGTISLTVKEALGLMITKSDNYAALLLTLKVRLSAVQVFLNEYGLMDSKVGTASPSASPTTTSFDTAMFFNKLYNGEFSNSQNTKEMISLLKKQVLNEKLPKNLPENTIVAHKTGELDGFSHDAGIVYAPNGEYVITVLSKSIDPKGANEKIVDLSKTVYDYFESR